MWGAVEKCVVTSNSISNLVNPPNLGSSSFGIAGGSECVPVMETSFGDAAFSVAMSRL